MAFLPPSPPASSSSLSAEWEDIPAAPDRLGDLLCAPQRLHVTCLPQPGHGSDERKNWVWHLHYTHYIPEAGLASNGSLLSPFPDKETEAKRSFPDITDLGRGGTRIPVHKLALAPPALNSHAALEQGQDKCRLERNTACLPCF